MEDIIDWDEIKVRHWDEYIKQCHQLGDRPSLSSFQVWYDDLEDGAYHD